MTHKSTLQGLRRLPGTLFEIALIAGTCASHMASRKDTQCMSDRALRQEEAAHGAAVHPPTLHAISAACQDRQPWLHDSASFFCSHDIPSRLKMPCAPPALSSARHMSASCRSPADPSTLPCACRGWHATLRDCCHPTCLQRRNLKGPSSRQADVASAHGGNCYCLSAGTAAAPAHAVG